MYLKFTALNILKHFKRSIIVLLSIIISVFSMEFITTGINGMKTHFFNNLLNEEGDIQINESKYKNRLDEYSLKYLINNPDNIIDKIKGNKQISTAEKIVKFGGMVFGKDHKNVILTGYGIENESVFFDRIRNNLIEGNFLVNKGDVLLSKKISEILDVKLNDNIIILVNDSTDSPFYQQFKVAGIFNSGLKNIDERFFYINHKDSEDLLYIDNSTIEIRVKLDNHFSAKKVSTDIKKALSSYDVTISSWEDIHAEYLIMIKFTDTFFLIINILLIIVVATIITNTIFMSVFERIKEFGTMRAIGLRKTSLLLLIIIEGLILGIIGAFLGILISLPLVFYFQEYGMYIGEVSETMGMANGKYYFSFSFLTTFINFISGVIIAIAVYTYAAVTCSNIKPIDALHHK